LTAKARVVAALISHPAEPNRFLVQQRLPGSSRALLWEFPGGKVEPGETDEAALARECHEELAVTLEVQGRVAAAAHGYEDLAIDLVLYRARITYGTPAALGANELRWASVDEMKRLPFCEADLPLIEALATVR
jgi:8-oxo-dGTP diphosphatase